MNSSSFAGTLPAPDDPGDDLSGEVLEAKLKQLYDDVLTRKELTTAESRAMAAELLRLADESPSHSADNQS